MSLYQLDVQQHELTARRRGMRRQFGLLPLDGAKVRVFPRSIGWEASGAKATMRRDVMQSIWLRFQGDSQERLGDARPGAGHCPWAGSSVLWDECPVVLWSHRGVRERYPVRFDGSPPTALLDAHSEESSEASTAGKSLHDLTKYLGSFEDTKSRQLAKLFVLIAFKSLSLILLVPIRVGRLLWHFRSSYFYPHHRI